MHSLEINQASPILFCESTMEKTQADTILERWESYESPDEKCEQWSTLLDYSIEIGNDYQDWNNDITYVQFNDGSILGWDCFYIRRGTEEEIRELS
jgi:hypothetical protein